MFIFAIFFNLSKMEMSGVASYSSSLSSTSGDWLPRDVEGQIKMGFTIVCNAFKSKVKKLEKEIEILTEDKATMQQALDTAAQKLHKIELEKESDYNALLEKYETCTQQWMDERTRFERLRVDLENRKNEVMAENKRLASHLERQSEEKHQLENFRKIIVDVVGSSSKGGPDRRIMTSTLTSTAAETRSPGKHSVDHSSFLHEQPRSTRPSLYSKGEDAQETQLFKHAKVALNGDQFSKFLSVVNRHADQSTTVDGALREAMEILGSNNMKLYMEFKNLIAPEKGC